MVMPKILIGCDPELFLRDKDGKAVSAWGKIPGDKANPHPVKGGAIQVDGNAVEFNINPASSLQEWNDNIAAVMEGLVSAIPGDTRLCIEPTIDFDPEYFTSLPEGARELGCNPDFSAYTEQENPRPDGNPPFRTASGHVHIGWTEGKDPNDPDHRADCIEVVKQLDFYLGAPALSWDKDSRRRLMYGKAGALRFKPYGVEYRTPSNMWLADKVSQNYVYNATIAAVTDLFEGRAMRVGYGENWAQNYIDGKFGGKFGRWNRDAAYAIQNGSKFLQKEADLLNMYDHFYKKAQRAAPKPAMYKGAGVDMVVVDDLDMNPAPKRRGLWAAAPPPEPAAAAPVDEPLFRGVRIPDLPDHELARARQWGMAINRGGDRNLPARRVWEAAGAEIDRRRVVAIQQADPNMVPLDMEAVEVAWRR